MFPTPLVEPLQDMSMVRIICHSLLGLVILSGAWCSSAYAVPPARPDSVKTKPSVPQITASSPLQSHGRTTAITSRDRLGVTSGSSTQPFRTTPMARRPDDFITQTRKMGDGTVATGRDRVGVTRSASTGKLGVSTSTRGPAPAYRSGLSSPTSYGRSWSGFRRVK